jgi:cysteinyl-tRNA synthetase
MEDDLNTALALATLHDLSRTLHRALGEKSFRQHPAAALLFRQGRDRLLEGGRILGLFQESPEEYFTGQRRRFLQTKGLGEEVIQDLITRREEARRKKDWARADEIRSQAVALGIVLEDGAQGTSWRPAG